MDEKRSGIAPAAGLVALARKRRTIILIAVGASFAAAPAADATTVTIGQVDTPAQATAIGSCGNCNFVVSSTGAGSPSYVVPPGSWVLTSFSTQEDSTASTGFRFFLAEPAGGSDYTLRALSDPFPTAADTLNTYPGQIPVQPGWVLGVRTGTAGVASRNSGDANDVLRLYDNTNVGTTVAAGGSLDMVELNASASLESDCDSDGLGDDTQDPQLTGPNCPPPPQPEPQPQLGDFNAPNATITKGPKDKTKKKTATFEFTGTDTRAVSGFECKLDAGPFAPCTSPHTVKVKKGKHTFQVQAIDQAGNIGAPATDTWKRKKKK
jgi:hypothetical protein